MITFSYLKQLASTMLLISLFGCTTKDSNSTVAQDAKAFDSSDIPEHIRGLENLMALDPSQPPQYEISFSPQEVYGEIYLEPVMMVSGNNRNIVSVDRNGRVYIIDHVEKNIHVYKPDGELLSEIGREGRGPGEFLDISTIRLHGDRLMVYDMTLKRIQWFDLETHDVHVVNLNPKELINDQEELILEGITSVMPLENGSILIGGVTPEAISRIFAGIDERTYYRYYVLDENGNLISDELFQTAQKLSHRTGPSRTDIPSSGEGIATVSPEGMIYHANTSQFLIHAIDVKDSTRRSIYYPFENASIDREKLFESYSDYKRPRMQDAEIGDHWPALHSLLADDENRLWVATITDDQDTHTWWILKDSGELLGRFDWPRSLEIETIRNGSMYVRERDWQEGVLTVQRHEIQMEPIN